MLKLRKKEECNYLVLDESGLLGTRSERGTDGKDPLYSKRYSPSPLVRWLIIAIGGAGNNN